MSSNQPPRLPVLVNLNNGARYTIAGPVTTLGRAPENNLVLPEDGYASAHHARIYWDQGRWMLEDLMSSNGTHVNEQMITAPWQLSPMDVIKVGRTFFRIE